MLTSIAHGMLISYAVTLSELMRQNFEDPVLRDFLKKEHLEAQEDLYAYLWGSCGGRLEVGRLIVSADQEGTVTFRLRGRTPKVWFAARGVN